MLTPMTHATIDTFSVAHDSLKLRHRCKLTNIFLDSTSLQEVLSERHCLQYNTDKALFLLVPRHNSYYDCLYMAVDGLALKKGIDAVLSNYHSEMSIRGAVIGKEPQALEIAEIFHDLGFRLTKRLLRMQLGAPAQKILDAMRPFADENRDSMSFATPDDAEEILEILKDNFDLVADNLPELSVIRDNIVKKQVAILRRDNKIASLHYFHIYNSTLHSLYDVTRKEYRKEGFFMALAIFINEYFSGQSKKSMRAFGWRDATNQKLVKHAKKSNQNSDGVIIYNMLWKPSGMDSEVEEHRK